MPCNINNQLSYPFRLLHLYLVTLSTLVTSISIAISSSSFLLYFFSFLSSLSLSQLLNFSTFFCFPQRPAFSIHLTGAKAACALVPCPDPPITSSAGSSKSRLSQEFRRWSPPLSACFALCSRSLVGSLSLSPVESHSNRHVSTREYGRGGSLDACRLSCRDYSTQGKGSYLRMH